MFAGVEAGGTKFVIGLGTGPGNIVDRAIIPTTSPDETIGRVTDWFAAREQPVALGLGSFGPVRIDRTAPDWGSILDTPKPGWSRVALGRRLKDALGVPMGLATDVTTAAMAEARWGAARGARLAVYLTVGTGIGGGVVLNGLPIDVRHHVEMGHVYPRRHNADLVYAGRCPFHGDCLEGLASGPSILDRWGQTLSALGEDHVAYDILADYLAQLVHNLRSMISPDRIVLGGGVANAPLVERIRARAAVLGGSYLDGDVGRLIALSPLHGDSGLLGAFALAELALAREGQGA